MTEIFDESTPSRRARRQDQDRKRRRARQRGRTLLTVLVALALVGGAVMLVLPTVKDLLTPAGPEDYEGPGTGSVMVELPPGSSGGAIATILHDADVVASTQAFIDAYNADPNATKIQAGFYNLQLQMPAADAVTALLDSGNRAEISVTVPPGTRAASVYERISTATGIPVEEVRAVAADPAAYGLPEEAGGNPEGWLGAQTYILPPNVDAATVLRQMVQETIGTLQALGIPREKWQESLIMASIAVEEGIEADYGKVVRVIINRSTPDNPETRGMLGMETVLNYGLDQDGVIPTAEQKQIDTPYNVFMHAGLPPTPISTPSRTAIEATINPPEGTWNYFVTVNLLTGETKFATTWEEFQVYIQEWREWQAANPEHDPGHADTPGMGNQEP